MPKGIKGFQKGIKPQDNPNWRPSYGMLGKTSWNKGKKATQEIIEKNKEAQKKVWQRPGYKKHMSEIHKGQIPVNLKSNHEKIRGKGCHFWKGGITPKNKKIRSSIEYRLWRESIFERDRFLCQMPDCNKEERYLEAHHIKTFSEFPELRFMTENGITLCKKCHQKTKRKEKQFENLFIEIIKNK